MLLIVVFFKDVPKLFYFYWLKDVKKGFQMCRKMSPFSGNVVGRFDDVGWAHAPFWNGPPAGAPMSREKNRSGDSQR